MKGVSPLIATILLIAFAVAIGGIFSLWITGFTNTQTNIIGTTGGQLIKCGDVTLDVKEFANSSFTGSVSEFNVTILYKLGTENLYNFTFYITGANDIVGKNFSSDYLKIGTSVNGMISGEQHRFMINTTPAVPSPLKSVRVTALCQDQYPVSTEEKCCDWTKS